MTVAEFYAVHNAHHSEFINAVIVILGVSLAVGFVGLFVQKVQAETSRRDLMSDFAMMLLIKFGLVGLFIAVGGLLAPILGRASVSGPSGLAFEPLASALPLPPILALVLYIVVRDFGQWLKHITLHRVPFLWHLHKIHHANLSLSIFADYRIHVLEVFLGSFVTLCTLVITGYPIEYAFIAISLEESVSMFIHSNLRLNYGPIFSRVLNSPQNHRIHHSRDAAHLGDDGDAYNYAVLFPIWDILNRSYFWDISVFPERSGLRGEERLENAGLFERQWIGLRDFFGALVRLLPGARAS